MVKQIKLIAAILIIIAPSSSIHAMTDSTSINGNYYWQKIFSYDNTDNDGEIIYKVPIKTSKSIDTKELLTSKFNVGSSYTYKNKSSAALKFEGSSVSGSTELRFHTDLARALSKTSNTARSFSESIEEERTYTIAGRSKLELYQLIYENSGMIQHTGIVNKKPSPKTPIRIDFSLNEQLLGLQEIQVILKNVRPKSSNAVEWRIIRDQIIRSNHKKPEIQLYDLVTTLSGITPSRDNQAEWASIRETCSEILSEWGNVEKQALLNKLLYRLTTVHPGEHNQTEWSKIRSTASNITSNMVRIL